MKKWNNKRFAILLAAIIVVSVGWTIGWFYIAGQLRQGLMSAASSEPALACATIETGGFPFRFDITCDEPVITSGDLTLKGHQLQATALFYRPTHVLAFAKGPATLSDAFLGTERELNWTSLEASVRFNGWRPERISLVVEDPALTDTLLGSSPLASAKHLELHLLDAGDAAETGMMKVAGFVRLDNGDFPGFDLLAANAEIALNLTPLPDDVRQWQNPQTLNTIIAKDGTLTLTQAQIDTSDFSADLKGEVMLDQTRRPSGKLKLVSKGLRARLATLLDPVTVTAIAGAPDKATGMDSQTFIIRDGTVSAAGLPLFRLAPLM